jgi:DHA1 family inner membrane transport protein
LTTLTPGRARLALLALALGGFGIGTTEFVAMGLLPEIARDLLPSVYAASRVDAEAQAGLLVSAYALGVVIGAPTIGLIAARWPRKVMLLWFAAAFTVGSVASALLPSFELVLAARFVAALAHGGYFGIASLVAASLLGPGKRGQGISLVLAGLTIANVIGVPLVTLLGQTAGWRSAYLVVAAIFAAAFVAILATVPWQPGDRTSTIGRELQAFKRGQVWLTLLVGSIGFGGFFAVYTYVAPMVTDVAALDASLVPLFLVAVGLGMTLGNLVGGRASDVNVMGAVFISFGAFALSLVLTIVLAGSPIGLGVALFLVGATSSALAPAIQARLLDVAGDSQTLAAATNHASLNLGNSLGAALGGVVIAGGLGYLAPTYVALMLIVPGVVFAVISAVAERRTLAKAQEALAA